MDKRYIEIFESPMEIHMTIKGYKCTVCNRPFLASAPKEDKWDTNILSFRFCPHCGCTLNNSNDENRTIHSENRTIPSE